MKIGITGYKGHVGQELLKWEGVFPLEGDIRKPDEIKMAIRSVQPDVVIHLASISDVDVCEDPKNKNLVIDTNLKGTYNVADAAEGYGCGVVLLSTDHVFDGIWGNYKEESKPSPKNFYGHSKMVAEALRATFLNLKVVRTSYLFTNTRLSPMIGKLVAGETQNYPLFIYRSFMWLPHFVGSLLDYVHRFDEMPNVLHLAGSQSVSYFAFMKDIARVHDLDPKLVLPRITDDPGMAPRPYKAGLNVAMSARLGFQQYSYLDGLREMKDAV